MALPARAVDRLREIVGPHAIDDPEVITSFTTDWTGRFCGHSPLVVRPGTTEEVAGVVVACRELELALVPQGGNTGLVGGGVPLRGEVVLNLGRLDDLGSVDGRAGQLTAGAGVTLAHVQEAAAAAGWSYGVDIASRGSATIGGTVATNAGGLRVLRYGATSAQLLGLEAVLGTGAVLSHLGGLVKDNTGYHWPSLMCGSEGTLAVVTAARLRLVPPMPFRAVALLAFTTVGHAVDATVLLRRALPSLEACELVLEPGIELVRGVTGMGPPLADRHPVYLLIEVADRSDPLDATAEAVDSIEGVLDVAVATEPQRRAELWRYREAHTEAINTLGPPHKLDVTLPQGALADFVDAVPAAVTAVVPTARTWLFGHVGDGNIHVNVTGLSPDDERVDDVVLRMAAGYGGSISAEHGIGTAKKRWLSLSRSPAELAAFGSLKRALDPDGILNPNVLVGTESS